MPRGLLHSFFVLYVHNFLLYRRVRAATKYAVVLFIINTIQLSDSILCAHKMLSFCLFSY